MGDPAKADEALIPPAVGFDDPDYILGRGQLDYAAEARLINDNLLDFSHLTFVHAQSFGSDPDFARVLPSITPAPWHPLSALDRKHFRIIDTEDGRADG
jgi:vanillate O-demethylase monooxygenase subunit